jgi:signal transduction histidine kinase
MAVAALPSSGESTPSMSSIPETSLPPPTDDAIRQDSVRLVYRQTSAGLIGHFLGWVVCTLVYWQHVPHHILWGWSLAFGVLWTGRFANLLSYERAALQGRIEPARWLRMWNTGAVIGATLWSIAALLFYGYGGSFERTFLMLTIYSFAIGAVPYMASQTPLFLTCMGLYFIPMILRTALNGGDHDLQLAGVWCLMCLCTLGLGRAFRNMFGEMVSLRSHAQDLARKLHGEMKAAEAAQRDAETANRAKTQFFAAASHDLRQPLHALGLFAEALRSRSKDEEVAQLVNSINNSVDALEGLFS